MKFRKSLAAAAVALSLSTTPAWAGIPVIDVASLTQAILEVAAWGQQANDMVNQIKHAKDTLEALKSGRGLGAFANDVGLQNYLPADMLKAVSAIDKLGHGGMTSAAKTLREAAMIYNCLDLVGAAQTRCQTSLSKPYQTKATMEAGLKTAEGQIAQIDRLMERAGTTNDPKEIAEIQARIGAENAMLQVQMAKISLLRGLQETEARLAESQAREGQLQQTTRTGSLGDFLK